MSQATDDLLARVHDKVENRFYGKYRALVVDNADPDRRGRLRLLVPSVLAGVTSGWALPCAPYGGSDGQGFFFIPERGDGVWVEFEAGLLEYPVWVGTFWAKPGGSTEVPAPANSQDTPTSKIIKTANHTIELADEAGAEALKILDSKSNKVTLDATGILIEDGNGNSVKLGAQGIVIDGPMIKVGGAAAEPLVKGQSLLALLANWHGLLASHVHTATGPAAPTTPAPTLLGMTLPTAALLSAKHKVE
jgi:uncharacterized protein involved in type VI secretion and phage assembly